MAGELKGLAILGDGPHYMVRYAIGDLYFYLHCYFYLGANQTFEMDNYLFSDTAGVTSHSGRIKHHAAVKTLWSGWLSRLRGG